MSDAAEVPIGEQIGGLVFWPVLIVLLGVIVWAYVKRRRQGGRTPGKGAGSSAHPAKSWTRPEDYADHHRVEWSADPSTFVPKAEHWPLAVAAVFGICGEDPWDELRLSTVDDARGGLQEAWGIRSRSQLLSRLHWILREGHRVEHEAEIDAAAGMDERELAQLAKDPATRASEHGRERLWRLTQAQADVRGIRDVDFEAWDLVRAAMLTRAGFAVGWLTEAETVDTLNLIAARLQSVYSGWDELGEHFLRARWFWGGGSGVEAQQDDAHDASRHAALLDPDRGPWSHVPWSMELPESRLLLVDALVDEELVVQPALDSPTALAEVIDAAASARLAHRS